MIVSSRDEQRYEIFSFFARKFPSSLTKKYLMGAWMFRVTYDWKLQYFASRFTIPSRRTIHRATDVPLLNNLANSINLGMKYDSDGSNR